MVPERGESLADKGRKMITDWVIERRKAETSKQDLEGADLSHTKLMEADLSDGHLAGADLSYAYLIKANLQNADLSSADLTGAVLSEANLTNAKLDDADLSEAYLNGVNLETVTGLTAEQIESAYIDRGSKFPSHIQVTWDENDNFTVSEKSG